jgi:flagellar biosynthesis anti-sigma factor FlgM
MRVNDTHTQASSAALNGARASEAVGRNAKALGAAAGAGVPGDSVALSSLAERVAALDANSAERAARTDRLAAEVASGRYEPDPLAISRAMIEVALAGEE